MKKIAKYFKENKKIIFIFIFTFLIYEFFGFFISNGDPINSYGFSHAIRIGEVPYRDFNTISTPLYAFYGSLGLFIFDNYITFILENCLLVTIMFYFLFKMFKNKAYIIYLSMISFYFFGLLPTYNFFAFFMMVIIMYLEKEHRDKNYLIGFFIGLAILSKHTIGIFLIIPSIIIYYREPKKVLKRLIGIGIPIIVFLVYLVCNNALFQFIDLCFLGLFDFGSSNSNLFSPLFFLSLLLLSINIYLIYKKPKEVLNYYTIVGFMFTVPLFDLYHFTPYFVCVVISLLPYIKLKEKHIKIISLIFIIEVSSMYSFASQCFNAPITKKINHFNYRMDFKKEYSSIYKANKLINKYKKNNPIVIGNFNMMYNIINDNKIDYYGVLLYGNYGYNGTNKMINKIKKTHNKIFVISIKNYKEKIKGNQFNKDIVKYIIDNSKLIEKKEGFYVYYKE